MRSGSRAPCVRCPFVNQLTYNQPSVPVGLLPGTGNKRPLGRHLSSTKRLVPTIGSACAYELFVEWRPRAGAKLPRPHCLQCVTCSLLAPLTALAVRDRKLLSRLPQVSAHSWVRVSSGLRSPGSRTRSSPQSPLVPIQLSAAGPCPQQVAAAPVSSPARPLRPDHGRGHSGKGPGEAQPPYLLHRLLTGSKLCHLQAWKSSHKAGPAQVARVLHSWAHLLLPATLPD